jgi:hypothetical protein
MTNQHTPGPWRWVPEPDTASPWRDYGDLYSASSEVVLSVWDDGFDGGVRVNSHADARLIEAAPELLEALEELVEACTGIFERDHASWRSNEDEKEVIKARSVIAKVRGTQ